VTVPAVGLAAVLLFAGADLAAGLLVLVAGFLAPGFVCAFTNKRQAAIKLNEIVFIITQIYLF
jgi:hypothetical protein